MKWFKILTKVPAILSLMPKFQNVVKQAREFMDSVKAHVNDPEVLKECEDVKSALDDLKVTFTKLAG